MLRTLSMFQPVTFIPTSDITILPATTEDLPAIIAISLEQHKRLYATAFSPEEIEEICRQLQKTYEENLYSSNCHTFVAKENGYVIGYARLEIEKETTHLSKLYLKHGCEGKGVGGKLLHHCMRDALQQEQHTMYLEVFGGNRDAIRFYEKYGFVKTGEHVKPTATGIARGDTMTCVDVQPVCDTFESKRSVRVLH